MLKAAIVSDTVLTRTRFCMPDLSSSSRLLLDSVKGNYRWGV